MTQMVDKLDWVIMPVFNVDGYVFTQQVIRIKSHLYQTLNMFTRWGGGVMVRVRVRVRGHQKPFFGPPGPPPWIRHC